jgi:1,4-dihydroxy-2-naphthoate octaprenyltransferase
MVNLNGSSQDNTGFFYFAGARYWTASILPALVGTTLPFWLRPAGFSFRWFGAVEFLITTVLIHAGFSLLQARFDGRAPVHWPRSRLLGVAVVCLITGCFLGLHLNSGLQLHKGVYKDIFFVYGLSTLFAGILYTVPPFKFYRRVGSEVILYMGLGLLPVLGSYLVQVGDITRKVYLAAFPLVVVTALWVWIDKLVTRVDDEKAGWKTMVILFGPMISGRYVVLVLCIFLYAILIMAVLTASIHPGVLVAVFFLGIVWRIITISWNEYLHPTRMLEVRNQVYRIQIAIGVIIVVSSLISVLH